MGQFELIFDTIFHVKYWAIFLEGVGGGRGDFPINCIMERFLYWNPFFIEIYVFMEGFLYGTYSSYTFIYVYIYIYILSRDFSSFDIMLLHL